LLQLAVTDYWVAIEKPHREGVPNLVFRLWKSLVDFPSEKVTDLPIVGIEGLVVLSGVGLHRYCPSGGRCMDKLPVPSNRHHADKV
jgi:hypothetical protein